MTEPDSIPRYQPQADWRPVPDPTELTDKAIARATSEFRRELDNLDRQLSERIDMSIKSRDAMISSMREVTDTRLGAMDHAADLLERQMNHTPSAIQTAVDNMNAVYNEKFRSLDEKLSGHAETYDERFKSVAQQFAERDVRTDQSATASASALAAALQAAKEAVFEQAQAAAKAAEKTELSFTKQIDAIGLQIKTVSDGFGDRIAELKERIDRGEGSNLGATDQRTESRSIHNESRLNMGFIISAILAIFTIITFVLYVTKK